MTVDRQGDDNTRSLAVIATGTLISHYKVIEMIGAGGMGEVYLAEDTKLNRTVAIKLLPKVLSSDPEFRARFTREARAVASLSHPGIVTVHEVGEYQGRPFFTMEHAKGHSLKEMIQSESLTLAQVVDVAVQVCEGMAEAHNAGLIHRDIKPSNILVDEKGRVRILDFGLARVAGEPELTRTPSLMGTIRYLSPEQVKGEELTPASDLFSIGVVLYQMLTGSMPFTGEYEASVLYAIVNDTPPTVGSLRPELPPQFEHILSKLLEKDPKNRFESATDVAAALRATLNSGVEDRSKVEHPSVKKTLRALFVIVPILIAVVVVVGWRLQMFRSSDSLSDRKMLAVLPFENLGRSEDEYFADGMTDAITMQLAKFGDLGVISRTSSMLYKDSERSLQEIGTELGAEYLVTGTIYWDRSAEVDRVRVDASLVRVADDSYLWGNSYERVLDRIFFLQSEIAQNVTRALHVAVGESELRPLQTGLTDNLEAYDFYLRGNEYFNRSEDREDIQFSIQMYEHAIELDPDFAAAYAMLSRGHSSMYSDNHDRSPERWQAAKGAANKALQLDPDLAEGHLALGYCYYGKQDFEQALAEFAVVQERQPNNRYLYNAIAAVQRRQGNLKQSVQNFLRALELDPRSHRRAFDVGLTFGMMHQYTQAETYLNRAIQLAPDWALPYIYRAWLHIFRDGNIAKAKAILAETPPQASLTASQYYWWLARVLESDYQKVLDETTMGTDTVAYYLHCAQIHRLMEQHKIEYAYADSARRILEGRMQQQPEEALFHSHLGLAYAGLRKKDKAIAHGSKAVELLPTSKEAFDAPFLVANLTETFVIFGEYNAAVEQIEFLLSIPGFMSVPYLKLDPLWLPLHDHPGFKRLLESEA